MRFTNELKRHLSEVRRHLRNKKYEHTEHGPLIVPMKATLTGYVKTAFLHHPMIVRAREGGDPEYIAEVSNYLHKVGKNIRHEYEQFALDEGPNMVPTAALTHEIATEFAAGAAVTARYLALFASDSTVALAWTAANYVTTYSVEEFVDYDEASRPTWQYDAVTTPTATNSPTTSDGEFTCNNVASDDLYGAFIISAATKSTNPGVAGGSGDAAALLSGAKQFTSAPRAVIDDDLVHLTYSFTLANA